MSLVIVWLIRISNVESLSTSKLNIKSQTSNVLGLFHINSVAVGHGMGKLDSCYQGVHQSIPSSRHSALVLPGSDVAQSGEIPCSCDIFEGRGTHHGICTAPWYGSTGCCLAETVRPLTASSLSLTIYLKCELSRILD
jgi:hypothetical protein